MLCYVAHTHLLGRWLSVNPKDQDRRWKTKICLYKTAGEQTHRTLQENWRWIWSWICLFYKKSYRDLRKVLQHLPQLANNSLKCFQSVTILVSLLFSPSVFTRRTLAQSRGKCFEVVIRYFPLKLLARLILHISGLLSRKLNSKSFLVRSKSHSLRSLYFSVYLSQPV